MISIQKAAEKYYPEIGYDQECRDEYTYHVTHYLSLLKAAGYEVVKTQEWIRLHGELAGANEHIKLLEQHIVDLKKYISIMVQQVPDDNEFIQMADRIINSKDSDKKKKWVNINDGYPMNRQKCWFYVHEHDSITFGSFYTIDSFGRENVFISQTGGHFTNVTKYMIVEVPDKPTPPEDLIIHKFPPPPKTDKP